jgi:hypothetical protein
VGGGGAGDDGRGACFLAEDETLSVAAAAEAYILYVCIYLCMYVCVCVYIYIYIYITHCNRIDHIDHSIAAFKLAND